MSYCRRSSHSDVYLYPSACGRIVCCACSLGSVSAMSVEFDTAADALRHLQAHVAAGQMVPDYAIERLQKEAGERCLTTGNR